MTPRLLDDDDRRLLERAYARLRLADGILGFLSEHFRDKYHLTPANEITPDGEILGPIHADEHADGRIPEMTAGV